MKEIKKKVSKVLLSLTMMFAMALIITPTNVFAVGNDVKLIDILDGKVTKLSPGTKVTWTGAEIESASNLKQNTTSAFFQRNGYTRNIGLSILRARSTATAGEYIIPASYEYVPAQTYFTNVIGNVTEWKVTADGFSFILSAPCYEISFNSGEGSGSMDEIYFTDTAPQEITLPNNTFDAPEGKQFKAWTFNETEYAAGGTVTANADAVVTAEWEDKSSHTHTHTPTTAWSKDDTNHWHECTANDGEKMDLTSHMFGEWVIDTPATETAKGSKHRDCTVCGQRETVETPATGVTPEKPVIIAGAGFTHQISNSKDMTLTCSGKLEDLTGVYIDGKLVDASNYTLKSGSTILTLKASYLNTLSAGKHTLKFQYKDNISAETNFTITAKEATKNAPVIKDTASPKTGDTSNTFLYICLVALSGGVTGYGLKKKKSLSKSKTP